MTVRGIAPPMIERSGFGSQLGFGVRENGELPILNPAVFSAALDASLCARTPTCAPGRQRVRLDARRTSVAVSRELPILNPEPSSFLRGPPR